MMASEIAPRRARRGCPAVARLLELSKQRRRFRVIRVTRENGEVDVFDPEAHALHQAQP